jgi:hypothetical protein
LFGGFVEGLSCLDSRPMWLIPSGPPVVTVGSKGNHPMRGR